MLEQRYVLAGIRSAGSEALPQFKLVPVMALPRWRDLPFETRRSFQQLERRVPDLSAVDHAAFDNWLAELKGKALDDLPRCLGEFR